MRLPAGPLRAPTVGNPSSAVEMLEVCPGGPWPAGKSGRRRVRIWGWPAGSGRLILEIRSLALPFTPLAAPISALPDQFRSPATPFSVLSDPFRSLAAPFCPLSTPFTVLAIPFRSLAPPFSVLSDPFRSLATPFSALSNQFRSLTPSFSPLSTPFDGLPPPFNALPQSFNALSGHQPPVATDRAAARTLCPLLSRPEPWHKQFTGFFRRTGLPALPCMTCSPPPGPRQGHFGRLPHPAYPRSSSDEPISPWGPRLSWYPRSSRRNPRRTKAGSVPPPPFVGSVLKRTATIALLRLTLYTKHACDHVWEPAPPLTSGAALAPPTLIPVLQPLIRWRHAVCAILTCSINAGAHRLCH
jgi:hypothetical protein